MKCPPRENYRDPLVSSKRSREAQQAGEKMSQLHFVVHMVNAQVSVVTPKVGQGDQLSQSSHSVGLVLKNFLVHGILGSHTRKVLGNLR